MEPLTYQAMVRLWTLEPQLEVVDLTPNVNPLFVNPQPVSPPCGGLWLTLGGGQNLAPNDQKTDGREVLTLLWIDSYASHEMN